LTGLIESKKPRVLLRVDSMFPAEPWRAQFSHGKVQIPSSLDHLPLIDSIEFLFDWTKWLGPRHHRNALRPTRYTSDWI
jgi:hypothetical protein